MFYIICPVCYKAEKLDKARVRLLRESEGCFEYDTKTSYPRISYDFADESMITVVDHGDCVHFSHEPPYLISTNPDVSDMYYRILRKTPGLDLLRVYEANGVSGFKGLIEKLSR